MLHYFYFYFLRERVFLPSGTVFRRCGKRMQVILKQTSKIKKWDFAILIIDSSAKSL
jgi:hypothetical protein